MEADPQYRFSAFSSGQGAWIHRSTGGRYRLTAVFRLIDRIRDPSSISRSLYLEKVLEILDSDPVLPQKEAREHL